MTMQAYLANIWFLIVAGIISITLLVLSANIAVVKLTGLAGFFRLSTTFVGVTVVSLATSIPEIASHITASFGILGGILDYKVSSAIVLGSNIGSDVIQQTLILGLVIFIAGTLHFKRYFLWKSMVPMITTTLMCIVLGIDGTYSRLDGLILFGTFIAYTAYLYYDERKHYKAEENGFSHDGEIPENVPDSAKQAWEYAGVSVIALAITIASAMMSLQITEALVVRTGLGGSMLGVVTLGIASALPEFTTAIAGIRNGDSGIPLGTLIGSNITNPLVAIGGGALISTYWVPDALVRWDLPWETLTGLLLWAILWFNKGDAGKKTAIYLTILYFVFVTLRAVFFGVD
jgi:cation:H+ antiporter